MRERRLPGLARETADTQNSQQNKQNHSGGSPCANSAPSSLICTPLPVARGFLHRLVSLLMLSINPQLSVKNMHYLMVLATCFLLASPQAHACRGISFEYRLFFETLPNPQPEADVIAKVSLSEVKDGTATAKVVQVLKTSDVRVQQGEQIPVKYSFTSCGPNPVNGAGGTIIANTGTDSEGHLVLYPYLRRYGDGHMTPPAVRK